jgi:geranylgeranyl transferase type-1 subunit beta
MTLAFFCLGAISLLGELDSNITEQNKKDWIDWIYAQQVLPTGENPDANEANCGFRGSSWSGRPFNPNAVSFEKQNKKTIEIEPSLLTF